MPKTVVIPFDDLRRLYLLDGNSSRKIAKIYGCAYSTVDRKIRKFGFPIKTLAAAHIKSFRKNFSGDLTERAYLVGFRIGDLRVRKFYRNSETLKIDCGSTRYDQIEHIESLFRPYGKIWISKPTSSGKVQIECCVDFSFKFLLRKYCRFPDNVTKNEEVFLSALAGFIDAEGSFFVGNNNQGKFSLGNYNLNILKQIVRWLKKMEIKHRLFLGTRKGYQDKNGYVRNGNYWILEVGRKKDLERFIIIMLGYLKYLRKRSDATKVLFNIKSRLGRWGRG